MITITTTRFEIETSNHIIQEKTICLFGWVICRWQERYSSQPSTK
jgi:hypothetical protein